MLNDDGYLQGHGFIVSWCIGHLIASAVPGEYDEKYKVWKYEDLPIIPEKWKYTVIAQTGKQFVVLMKLMHDPSVTGIAILIWPAPVTSITSFFISFVLPLIPQKC